MRWRRVLPPILAIVLLGGQCDREEASRADQVRFLCSGGRSIFADRNAVAVATPLQSAVSAGTGSSLPMLNAFPTCQPTLDLGFSEERVGFGPLIDQVRGTFACFPSNNPVQISVTEGSVDVVIEAAAVALPDPNPETSVARFAIEGRSSITGGTASAAPSWLIQAGYLFPHTGSPTGTEPIRFGATLINVNATGGAAPLDVVGEVRIDCGVGEPTVLPVNEGPVDVPVEATSSCGVDCACTANANLSGGAAASAGEAVQRLTVFAFNTNGLCGSNERCRNTEPSNPFCVDDFGCSNGSVGMPCDHDSQCDSASGVICAVSLLCEDGSAGASCSQAEDCAVGLACSSDICSVI